jgi:TPP-dependent pyruvate/acetoin dehydrogenase alpha subunit
MEKEKLTDMYRKMVRIRKFEDRVRREFASGKIPGFVHLYAGEEATAVGACASLRPNEYAGEVKQKRNIAKADNETHHNQGAVL